MRYTLRYTVCCLCLWLAVAGWTAEPKIADAEQATARATTFVRDVGWETTALQSASHITTIPLPHAWMVKYPATQGIILHIDSITGAVVSAINNGALHRLPTGMKVGINKSQANSAAKTVLEKAGITDKILRIASSTPVLTPKPDHPPIGFTSPGRLPTQHWIVRYQRIYRGYTFINDRVDMQLHPLDASLLSFTANCSSPLPKSIKIAIKKDAAEKIARQLLVDRGIAITSIEYAKLLIVQPNLSYEKVSDPHPPSISRLAWVVHCNRKPIVRRMGGKMIQEGDNGHFSEVWVDAENGNFLGGMACR